VDREKHEENHQPMMQKGVAIKYNANQRYATTSITAFLLKELARRHGVPIQEFVVRNDSPCGSTIGPILSAGCGIRTIDIGLPQLSMHSIREMCGADDVSHAVNLLKVLFFLLFEIFFFKEPGTDLTRVSLFVCLALQAFYSGFTKLDESLVVD
jgi:aspartyl aminopeptidase